MTDDEGSTKSQTIGLYVGGIPADSAFTYSYYKDRTKSELVYVSDKPQNVTKSDKMDPGLTIFPNPFKNNLSVSFTLTEMSKVSIDIYNTMGKRVDSLIPNNQFSEGSHFMEINTDQLNPGIYIMQIKTKKYMVNRLITKL